MKKLICIAILAMTAVAAQAAAPASEQRYLLNTDVAAAQPSATTALVQDGNGERIVATFQRVDGTWVKHTLTKTNETQYGAFGERVVRITDIFPNP